MRRTAATVLAWALLGSAAFADTAEEEVRAGMKQYLRDPASAQIEVTRPARHGSFTPGYLQHIYTGQIICARVNAKNAYGAYVGFKSYIVITEDDGSSIVLERSAGDKLFDQECGKPADQVATDAPAPANPKISL